MPTEVHFMDAANAAVPQAQVAMMSKTQLVQNVTVLQAGWASAVKRLNDETRNRELDERAVRDDLGDERGLVIALKSALQKEEVEVRAQRQRIYELESEVAGYRRAARALPGNPIQAKTEDDLIQARGRILELERLLRQRDPLNTQFLKIRVEEMTRQRDQDRLRIQEDALNIARLRQQLKDAEEALAFHIQSTSVRTVAGRQGSTQPAAGPAAAPAAAGQVGPADGAKGQQQPARSARWDLVLAGARNAAQEQQSLNTAAKMQDVGVQVSAAVVKTIEMLEEKNRTIDAANTARDIAVDELAVVRLHLTEARATIDILQRSEQRKEELLARVMNTPTGKASLEVAEMVRREDEKAALVERTKRLEAALALEQSHAREWESKCSVTDSELSKLSRAFAAVAEENVQLSHALQALGPLSAKDVAVLVNNGEKVSHLRTELAALREALEHERVNQDELKRVSRENGVLCARVEQYQVELAAIVSENSRLSNEIERISALSPSSKVLLDRR